MSTEMEVKRKPHRATGKPKGTPRTIMNAREAKAFKVYLGLGEKRSLTKLAEALGEGYSLHTVGLWCKRFKWVELIGTTNEEIQSEVKQYVTAGLANRVERALQFLEKLEEKFYKKVNKGEIDVGLDEFMQVLRARAMLTGMPVERTETTVTHKVQVDVADIAVLQQALRAQASRQLGLAPAITTYEQADEAS